MASKGKFGEEEIASESTIDAFNHFLENYYDDIPNKPSTLRQLKARHLTRMKKATTTTVAPIREGTYIKVLKEYDYDFGITWDYPNG